MPTQTEMSGLASAAASKAQTQDPTMASGTESSRPVQTAVGIQLQAVVAQGHQPALEGDLSPTRRPHLHVNSRLAQVVQSPAKPSGKGRYQNTMAMRCWISNCCDEAKQPAVTPAIAEPPP
jgi:hypothetical protein